jgi:hypothetical protein
MATIFPPVSQVDALPMSTCSGVELTPTAAKSMVFFKYSYSIALTFSILGHRGAGEGHGLVECFFDGEEVLLCWRVSVQRLL